MTNNDSHSKCNNDSVARISADKLWHKLPENLLFLFAEDDVCRLIYVYGSVRNADLHNPMPDFNIAFEEKLRNGAPCVFEKYNGLQTKDKTILRELLNIALYEIELQL